MSKQKRYKTEEERREAAQRSNQKWEEANPEKRRECGRLWRLNNPSKHSESNRKWEKKNPEKVREAAYRRHLLRTFGMTTEQYQGMLKRQRGVCKLCGKDSEGKRLVVDHDHASGVVRGLLCHKCNTALSTLEKDRKWITKAINYLKRKPPVT
jgi:hypothetical protein